MKPAICTNNPSQPYKYPQRNYNPVAQPAKNSEDRFHAEMKNLSQKDLPQSGNRPNSRPRTGNKKDMRPRLMNDHLGYKVSTPEEVGTKKEEVTNPEPMGGDETPPELAGQLNWDLLEPD